jgi:FkbM family methyltransferase
MNINDITNQYNLIGGTWNEEKIEQNLCLKYINSNNNVLELGSNIGHVSIIISHILKSGNGNLVTLETNSKIYDILVQNKNINNLDFIPINKALSKRPISQIMYGNEWNSYPTNELHEHNVWSHVQNIKLENVENISFEEIQEQTNIKFDTLVIDCEGAFYFILKDFPDILDNIKLIIIENDCIDEYQNTFILDTFKNNNFNLIESKTLDIAWGSCKDYFWQVWKKN